MAQRYLNLTAIRTALRVVGHLPIAIAFLASTGVSPSPAIAITMTSGGVQEGVFVQNLFTVHQGAFPDFAEDLHFRARNKGEGNPPICIDGWNITLSHFTNSASARLDPCNNIGVSADGAMVPFSNNVVVAFDVWMREENSKQILDVIWTKEGEEPRKGAPGQGWEVGPGRAVGGGIFNHLITISNLDETDPFLLTDVCTFLSPLVPDISQVPCSGSLFDPVLLGPGQTFSFDVPTAGPFLGNYIYFGYTIRTASDIVGGPGGVIAVEVAGHPVTMVVTEPETLLLISMALLALTATRSRRETNPAIGRRVAAW